MSLIQLEALRKYNLGIDKSESVCYEKTELVRDETGTFVFDLIKAQADQYELLQLIITMTGSAVIDDVLKSLSQSHLYLITTGGQVICSIPVGLLMKRKTPTVCNNSIGFDVPTKFNDVLDICTLHYMDLKYTIHVNSPFISSVSAVGRCTILGSERRRQLMSCTGNGLTKQIEGHSAHYIVSATPMNTFAFNLKFKSVAKGYYIDGDIRNLSRIQLHLNNYVLWDYDAYMIQYMGKRLHESLLYIGYDKDVACDDYSLKAYETGLCHARVDNVRITLTFNVPQTSAAIYDAHMNQLRYRSGLAGIVYVGNYNPTIEKI